MPTITINLNSEITDITSYDVFISECDPISWQLVADDISYDDFPIYVDPAGFDVDGPCFEYYISGDTGCYCQGTDYLASPTPTPTTTPSITPTITTTPSVTPTITTTPSVTPTITITPSVTPTITTTPTPTPSTLLCQEVTFEQVSGSSTPSLELELFTNYITTSGSLQYHSICDAINCGTNFSANGYIFTGGTYAPTSGLSQSLTATTEILDSDCNQWSSTDFFNSSNWQNGSSPSLGDLYGAVTGSSGTTIYLVSNSGGNMVYSLHATCDYTGNTEGIVGIDVELNDSSQWVINGDIEPDLTLQCGIEYHFHICSSGSSTTFWLASDYNDRDSQYPNNAALGSSDGVDNNGTHDSTIIVNLSADGTNGGYYYGTNDEFGASGRIFTTGC